MYFVTAALARRVYSSGVAAADERRQAAVALLLELQRRVRPRQLALQQHDFVVPRQRHEVHVLQAPGVVSLPMPDGPVFDGACCSSQATNSSVAARRPRSPR